MTTPVLDDVRNFWMNVALGLKDEMVMRGNRIDELEQQFRGKLLYAHRNGEAEPPTQLGEYWFDGYGSLSLEEELPIYAIRGKADVIEDDDGLFVLTRAKDGRTLLLRMKDLRGKWHGPITSPWEPTP